MPEAQRANLRSSQDGDDEVLTAVSLMARLADLHWAVRSQDGSLIYRPPGPLPRCAATHPCPLDTSGHGCESAAAAPLPPEYPDGGYLVACSGVPGVPLAQGKATVLAEAVASCHRLTSEIESAVHELTATYQELAMAYGALEDVSISAPRESIAQSVLERIALALDASAGCLLLFEEDGSVGHTALYQMGSADLQELMARFTPGRRQGILQPDWFFGEPGGLPLATRLADREMLTCPVESGRRKLGMLIVLRPPGRAFTSREAKLLRATSRQAGLAISNQVLVEEVRQSLISTVEALAAAIEAKDSYTIGHSLRVAEMAETTARRLGLDEERVNDLRVAALVHDIGKIGVDTAILRKAGRLDPGEWHAVRLHPSWGASIIGHVPQLQHLVPVVRHHHERQDGSGYPDGLIGEAIPVGARIIIVCDAYDAMTSMRPYRGNMTREAAESELHRCSGTHFDPQILEAFVRQ